MFKTVTKHLFITLLAFYITSVYLVPGFKIPLNLLVYLQVVVIFSLLGLIVKPILKLIFLPINFLTLGLFSWLINVILLYFLKALVPQIIFTATSYPALFGETISLQTITLPTFGTVVLASLSLTILTRLLHWLMGK